MASSKKSVTEFGKPFVYFHWLVKKNTSTLVKLLIVQGICVKQTPSPTYVILCRSPRCKPDLSARHSNDCYYCLHCLPTSLTRCLLRCWTYCFILFITLSLVRGQHLVYQACNKHIHREQKRVIGRPACGNHDLAFRLSSHRHLTAVRVLLQIGCRWNGYLSCWNTGTFLCFTDNR